LRCHSIAAGDFSVKKKAMIMRAFYMPKKQFSLEDLDGIFELIVSVLEFVIPILLATVLIYFSVIPLSILAVAFTYINKTYHKRLPAFIIIPQYWLFENYTILIRFWIFCLPPITSLPFFWCRRCQHFHCCFNLVSKELIRESEQR